MGVRGGAPGEAFFGGSGDCPGAGKRFEIRQIEAVSHCFIRQIENFVWLFRTLPS
jgi:hypothetical protein